MQELKENNNCILTTVNYLEQIFELDFDKKKSLESVLFRNRDRVKMAKKSLDCLDGEWWHSNITMEPEVKRNRISDPLELPSDDEAEVATLSVIHKKSLESFHATATFSTLKCAGIYQVTLTY